MKKYLTLTKEAWQLLSPFHKRFYADLFLIFSLSAVAVFVTYLSGKVLTEIVNKNMEGLLTIIVFIFLANLLETILTFLRNYNEEKYLNQDIAQHLQKVSLERILALTPEQHVEDHSAIKQQIITRGENAVEAIVKTYISTFSPNISYVVITIATLFYYSTTLGSITLIFSVVLIFWIGYFLSFYKPLVRKNRDNWTQQAKIKTEAFTHLSLVKTLGRENYFINKYLTTRKGFVEFGKYVALVGVNHRGKRSVYADVTQGATLLVAGVLAVKGIFPLATVYVIWNITNRAFWSITSLTEGMRDLPIRYSEVEQYFDAIDMEPSFKESGRTDVSLNADIIFNGVSFLYKKSTSPVFDSLSFTIPAKKITAFVGHSGSGKSTLTKLLLRSYAYSTGSIKIGDTELNSIDATYLREHIGYVEQHVDLLDDTIKENIIIAAKEKFHNKTNKTNPIVIKTAR